MFTGKYEKIIENTLGRYQQGGIMGGDIVKIKPNALKHPKVKDMSENMKGNIKMLMDTDLHITVIGVRSTRDSRGEMSDGLGVSSTTSPTDFWCDVAVNHSPGFRGDPVTLPIEVLEKQDFGANLPPIPDSQKRVGNVNIKPIDASDYVVRMGEGIEDVYSNMSQPDNGGAENVTVRVPLEDCDEVKDIFDQHGVTYSVIGDNRYELHGTLDVIQKALNATASTGTEGVEVEVISAETEVPATQQIPNETGIPDTKKKEESIEEAYAKIFSGEPKPKTYTISVPSAFGDNVKYYLNQEGVNSISTSHGDKIEIDIISTASEKEIEDAIRENVMGDMTFLSVKCSKIQN